MKKFNLSMAVVALLSSS